MKVWVRLMIGFLGVLTAGAQELPKGVTFEPGPLNSVSLERNGRKLIVYGSEDPVKAEHVLLTHVRRDLAEFARDSAEMSGGVTTPASSAILLTDPDKTWRPWWTERFDYYGQEVTKWPIQTVPVKRKVSDGDTFEWEGLTFHVIQTPGYTEDMVAYLVNVDGTRVAFTGDLIWEGGRVFDLYSFQNEIPDAKVGNYHGYGGRFGPWIESLRRIAAEQPDLIIPLRGPLIANSEKDIDTVIERTQAIYKNYLSTNALHWYFGPERMTICGQKVLGEGASVELMPFCQHIDLPDWCQHIGTTKLLISEDKHGFVLDVGGQKALDTLKQVVADGLVKQIDGIWVTHTHNDHSRSVADAAKEFGCPVYAVWEVADVLENPGHWFLPGVSPNAVEEVTVLEDGETLKWKEFVFTAHFYPGQMYNHGALLVEKPGHEPVYFIGDSFSPSGIDDYCMMNQNLMREDTGYLYCLEKVRTLPNGAWLVNEHIPHLFRFTDEELDYLESRYRERIDMIAKLVPWDDPNYAIDEQWAWFYPYGTESAGGDEVELEVRIRNHSIQARVFNITLHDPSGRELETGRVEISGREEGTVTFMAKVPESSGVHVYTASIKSEGMDLRRWCEALIRVKD